MVLDPKTGGSHNDYGSISCEGCPGLGSTEAVPETPGPGGSGVAPGMTQNDLYQRQPLLPVDVWASKNGSGSGIGGGTSSGGASQSVHTSTDYSEDDDDSGKRNHHKRNAINANGVVRIEMPTPHRDEPRFPKEHCKTIIALLLCGANMVLTVTSLALVHEKVPDRSVYGPLPDVFLDNFPTASWALDASEIIIMISTTVTFGVLILHKHRWIVFRRVFLMLSVLYFMRSISMYVTVLPTSSPTYYCSPKANSTNFFIIAERVFKLVSGFGLSINGKHTYCGDYIYSGHTVILCMCYLLISEYSPKKCYLFHWASFFTSLVGIILVLVARGHYTVDVLIAYYVTTRLFWMYHTLANHAYLKQRSANNCLSRLWWFRCFCYFEGNVGAPVPRQYDWPLPWPRRFLAKHPNRDS